MRLQKYGTVCPRDAAAKLRRGMLAAPSKRNGSRPCLVALMLLACVMMAGVVSADEGNVAKIGDTEYATLADAISDAESGAVITLIDNTTINSTVEIPTSLTLNLNGYTIQNDVLKSRLFNVTQTVSFTIDGTTPNSMMLIRNEGTYGFVAIYASDSIVTLQGGTYSGDTDNGAFVKIFSGDNVTLKLKDVTGISNYRFLDTETLENVHEIAVIGGEYYTEKSAFGVDIIAQSPLTFENVKVIAGSGPVIEVCGPSATFRNCDFTITADPAQSFHTSAIGVSWGGNAIIESGKYVSTGTGGYGVYIYSSGGSAIINGGEFQATTVLRADVDKNSYPNAISSITVTNGHFEGGFTTSSEDTAIIIRGGTFTSSPEVYLPDGYVVVQNGASSFSVARGIIPSIESSVITTENGQTTVMVSSEDNTYDETTNTVILSAGDKITVNITFDGDQTGDLSSGVTGTVESMAVIYDGLDLGDEHTATIEIPLVTENPAYIVQTLPTLFASSAERVTQVQNSLATCYANSVLHVLIEAALTDLDTFNKAIHDNGMMLTFNVPANEIGENPAFYVAHFNENGELMEILSPIDASMEGGFWIIKVVGTSFSGYAVFTDESTPVNPSRPSYSSSDGNMDNAFRVLFNDGSTTISVVTDLSAGDKLTKPETPVKDGYTFAGWYKDSACTQAWDFETGIPGDMTLYAKWTAAGSSGETEATATPTKTQTAVTTPQPTKTQTAAATTSAPQATTAIAVSPTLTQAPAPVAGALFGLLAAGLLLRRRN